MNTNEFLNYEEWRSVVGYESFYEVSNLGRIRSIGSGQGRRTGKILKQWVTKLGYMQVELQVDNSSSGPLVHTLVAQAFLGQRPKGKEVDHVDGDKTNNMILNLRYVTRSENINARNQRLRKLGLPLTSPQHGEFNPQAVLTETQVNKIRLLYKEGLYQRELASMYRVTRGAIGKIVRNERWKTS